MLIFKMKLSLIFLRYIFVYNAWPFTLKKYVRFSQLYFLFLLSHSGISFLWNFYILLCICLNLSNPINICNIHVPESVLGIGKLNNIRNCF